MVTCTISGTCQHEANLALVLRYTHSTIFVSNLRWVNRLRRGSLGVKTSNTKPCFVIRFSNYYFSQNMSDGYMSRQEDIAYNHV